MNDKKLYMIGNAHLDPVWLWQWQEGFQEIKATFRSALDRMNEYPEFVFTSSSAAYYEWIEQNDPAMFEEIKQRVAEGRWQIVGGWWVQPDTNLPSGESFVRQALYGQHYFRDKLGVTARTGYCVDSFGHAGTLPQILKKSGLDYYVFLRPGAHEKGLSAPLFRWESDDGSQVLAFRILYEYCTSGEDIEKHVRRCAADLKSPLDRVMCFYGVGNHGGGPTRKNIESIRRLGECADLPEFVFSSPDRFFADVERDNVNLPVVHHDLQNHARGCYSAHSGVKRWNRQAENLLASAEKFASIAARVTGQPYPAADLRQAWKAVLFNQFHDILAGTSIEAAYEDARNGYGEAASLASRALNHAIQSLAWNIRIAPEESSQPIVVFNPHAWQSKTSVELEFGKWSDAHRLVDDAGHNVPVQLTQPQGSAKERSRLCFVADLPPLGYRLYRVTSEAASERPNGKELPVVATDTTLENEYLRLEIDPLSGCIQTLYDKRANVHVFEHEAARAVVLQDESDTWSHNTFRYDCPAGEFRPRRVRLVEHGPVRAVIRVESEYGASLLVQDFTLYRELDQVDVRVTVDWREQFRLLKLRFPLNLTNVQATYEIPYGHIERPANGDEEPGQSWVDLSGLARETRERYGLAVLNDGKYSFDVNLSDIGLTVLRSPIYAHHLPIVPDPNGLYSFIDQGIQHFSYSLVPHSGSWEDADIVRRAAELNARPITLLETFHAGGSLPPQNSYVGVDRENIVVSALKLAEDGQDLIVRAYETAQVATDATIRLAHLDRAITAHFGPCEIKTFRVPVDPDQPIIETNMLEDPI